MAVLDLGKHKGVVHYGFLDLSKIVFTIDNWSVRRLKEDGDCSFWRVIKCLDVHKGCRYTLAEVLNDEQFDRLIEWVIS